MTIQPDPLDCPECGKLWKWHRFTSIPLGPPSVGWERRSLLAGTKELKCENGHTWFVTGEQWYAGAKEEAEE